MMAKDVDQICQKYELKLRTGSSTGRVDGDCERQVESFRQSVARADEKRTAVSQLLSSAGIYSIWWPSYFGFSRRVAKLVERIGSTDVLRLEARMQLEVWVARGLVRAVLEAIARDVFDLDLTGPIKPLDGSQVQT
jgi:hypothetical protein